MKIKEYKKIKEQMQDNLEMSYCCNNDIDYEEFKKAQDKNNKILAGITLAAEIVLLGLFVVCSIFENKKENKVTTPVISHINRAINYEKPIELNNQSSSVVQYSLYQQYNERVEPHSVGYMPIDASNNRTMYFESDSQIYYISDDLNFYGMTDEFETNEEAFNGTFINFYDNLNTNVIYLNFQNARLGSIENTWLYGENINTGVNRVLNVDYTTPTYSLNFRNDYVNHYNTFNTIRVYGEVKKVNYGYTFLSKIYARNSSTNTNVLIAMNQSQTNSNPITNGNNLDINASSTYFSDSYYLAPYLEDSSLNTNGTWQIWYYYNNIGYLRPWVSNERTLTTSISLPSQNSSGEDLWNNIGDLIKVTFISLLPIGEIYILPMVTIGALIFTPIILLFIMLVIKVVRK